MSGPRIAMIGYGKMGRAHSHGWRTAPAFFPGLEAPLLQVVVGRNQPALTEMAHRFGWAETAADWRQVVTRPDIDIVDICVPASGHAPIALAALAAGKHVVCEKPLALTVNEAEQMAAAAAARPDLRTLVCFTYRFVPALHLARRMLDRGDLGRLYQVRARFLQDHLTDPGTPFNWKQDPAVSGGGALIDLGGHVIDMLRFLVGDLTSVLGTTTRAVQTRPLPGGEGTAEVLADEAALFMGRLAGGVPVSAEVSRIATGYKCSHVIEIHGERGALKFDFERMNELQFFSRNDPPDAQGFRTINVTRPGEHPYAAAWWGNAHGLGFSDTFTHLALEFLTALQEGRPASPSFADGLYAQRVIEAVLESESLGSWVSP